LAVMEISVVLLGQGPSISSYVGDCIRILKREKVPYEITSMGTNMKLPAHRAGLPGDE
jgi:uncharacterized protein YqgV (UPF0045/DUF77 family)